MTIYFIQERDNDQGNIKIGHSTGCAFQRLRQHQGSSPVRLSLIGAIAASVTMEKILHQRFKAYYQWGEWFAASTELKAYIRKFARGDFYRSKIQFEALRHPQHKEAFVQLFAEKRFLEAADLITRDFGALKRMNHAGTVTKAEAREVVR